MPTEGPATTASATPDEQNAQMRAVWKLSLTEGETWYVVDNKWFQGWCSFTGFDPNSEGKTADSADAQAKKGDCPDKMDNSSLQDPDVELELKGGLSEGIDYALVPEEGYKLLFSWYGGGPAFPRKVITVGIQDEARLDFYPLFVKCLWLDASGEPDETTAHVRSLDRMATFQDLIKDAQNDFKHREDDDNFVRVWIPTVPEGETAEIGPQPEGAEEPGAESEVGGDGGEDSKEVKYELLRGNAVESSIATRVMPPNAVVWLEKKQEDKWVRSHVKQDWQNFVKGDIIDARDTANKWYESTVLSVKEEEKQILVHFNGWPSRWDEWISMDSDRLAMQNEHTTGPYEPRRTTTTNSSYFTSSYSYYSPKNEEGTPPEKGAVGLRNLGNTCFMNSTLQCLSNTPGLTNFFLDGTYTNEINRDNPLGWQGRIAEEYGALIKDLWCGKYTTVAPKNFKDVLGQFAPRFSGYMQHDSSELLSFLLDGLHEDLNRVLKKPATSTVESDGRDDKVVAAEAWEVHQKRHQSIVVDTLQGQLKSKLVCPDCGRVSVTFDPFMFLSVPLPLNADKSQEITFVYADDSKPNEILRPLVTPVGRIYDLKVALAAIVNVPTSTLVVADVWHNKFHRIFADEDAVSEIRSTDTIFVYQCPELENMKLHQTTIAAVIQQRRGSADGLPFPIVLPKEPMYPGRTLFAKVNQRLSRYLKPGIVDDAFTLRTAGYRGEVISDTDEEFRISSGYHGSCITVDWDEDCFDQFYDMEKAEQAVDASKDTAADGEAALSKKNPDALDLSDCLAEFAREEKLGEDDAWYCRDCKKHQQATKKFDLWRLPEVLVIHLKRFSYSRWNRDKISTYVDFPLEGLDLRQFVANEDEHDAVYDLYAVSNHMGGLGGGHYTAYAMNLASQKWWCLDDSSVSRVDESTIKSSSAYVLFYRRRSPRGPEKQVSEPAADAVNAAVEAE